MAIGRSDFTPIQDYTVLQAKKALVMLKECAEYGDEIQMDRGARAYRQLSAYVNNMRKKHFDEIAEIHFKSEMNRVMRYAESVLGINMSKFDSVLGDEFRRFSGLDVMKARRLLADVLDSNFQRQGVLLQKEELNEADHEALAVIENKISSILSANSQLERAIKSRDREHFDEVSRIQCTSAVEDALIRIDNLLRTPVTSIGWI